MNNVKRGGGDNRETQFCVRTSIRCCKSAADQNFPPASPPISLRKWTGIQPLGNPRNSAAASRLSILAPGTNWCCIPGLVPAPGGISEREGESLHLKWNGRKVLSQGSGRLRDPAVATALRNSMCSGSLLDKTPPTWAKETTPCSQGTHPKLLSGAGFLSLSAPGGAAGLQSRDGVTPAAAEAADASAE